MILTTVFATLGTVGAGGTAWFANASYFNKGNDKETAKWTAAFALAGGLAAGGIGYGIDAAFDAVVSDDETAQIQQIETTKQDALAAFSSKLTV